jgi:uncharacterized paraquat-inducible protein A
MKRILYPTLIAMLTLLAFFGCNSNKPKATATNNAHQEVNQRNSFPRPSGNVICHNCRASFKISANMQKASNGHSYIECPVCHHDYSKKQ